MKTKNIQLVIGIFFLILGAYQVNDSVTINYPFVQGIVLGVGSMFVIWGIREIIGYAFKKWKQKY